MRYESYCPRISIVKLDDFRWFSEVFSLNSILNDIKTSLFGNFLKVRIRSVPVFSIDFLGLYWIFLWVFTLILWVFPFYFMEILIFSLILEVYEKYELVLSQHFFLIFRFIETIFVSIYNIFVSIYVIFEFFHFISWKFCFFHEF
jgi:hypothetical protein